MFTAHLLLSVFFGGYFLKPVQSKASDPSIINGVNLLVLRLRSHGFRRNKRCLTTEPCGFNMKESNHGITFITFLWLHSRRRVNRSHFFFPPPVNGLTLSWRDLPSPLDVADGKTRPSPSQVRSMPAAAF